MTDKKLIFQIFKNSEKINEIKIQQTHENRTEVIEESINRIIYTLSKLDNIKDIKVKIIKE